MHLLLHVDDYFPESVRQQNAMQLSTDELSGRRPQSSAVYISKNMNFFYPCKNFVALG